MHVLRRRMPPFLHIPLHQAEAITAILACGKGKSVAVSQLPLDGDEEKLDLVMALHSWGVPSRCRCIATLAVSMRAPLRAEYS